MRLAESRGAGAQVAIVNNEGGRQDRGGAGRGGLSIGQGRTAGKAETVFSSRFQRVFPYPTAELPA